jgi:hypothetical protein
MQRGWCKLSRILFGGGTITGRLFRLSSYRPLIVFPLPADLDYAMIFILFPTLRKISSDLLSWS